MQAKHRGAASEVRPDRVFLLNLLILLITAVAARWLLRNQDPYLQSALHQPLWGALQCAFFLLVAAASPQLRRMTLSLRMRHAPPSPSDVVLAFVVMFGWGLGLSRLLFHLPFVLADPTSAPRLGIGIPTHLDDGTLFFAAISAGVLTPLVEELVSRGFLQNLWIARYGTWRGLLLASLAFGVMHGTRAPFAFVMGIVLGLVYIKYRSLVLCMLLHGLYNLTTMFTPVRVPFLEKPASDVANFAGWVPEIALSIVLVPLAVLFWRRFKPKAAAGVQRSTEPGRP